MNRIQVLQEYLAEQHADAMMLTGEVNLIYLTNTTALEGQCLIFKEQSPVFVTDGRYTEVAEKNLIPKGFQVLTRNNTQTLYDVLSEILREHGAETLMYEDDVYTVMAFEDMREKINAALVPIGKKISEMRAYKDDSEVECIIHAQRIAEKALEQLIPEFCEGMTEREAAAKLNYYMALYGSEKPSFDTIVLFGENTSKPHGVPGDRKLQKGDFILLDFGAVYCGYHSDMTRTFAFGAVTEEMRRVYETVLQAQQAAYEAAAEGSECRQMHIAAANVIEQAGYGKYFTHALGHSVGLEIHESPVAAVRCSEPLKNGIVMTDEPGIYLPGKFGVRIEDMLMIDGKKARNLTNFPKELQVLSP
ncbi:MAG: Xaa-Pro peptidase family protein [Oscillospiraceae bacterium]|nr:Xaa-Pro peptidase family protein [Oscillospiraceae bacterium]